MADLSSLSLSDLVSGIRERCSTPNDIQNVISKLDIMASQDCTNSVANARDFASVREEAMDTRAAVFNRIGDSEARFTEGLRSNDKSIGNAKDILSTEHNFLKDEIYNTAASACKSFADTQRDIQDSKFQIHDNIVKHGTDVASQFGRITKDVSDAARDGVIATEKTGWTLSREAAANTIALERKLDDMTAAQAACCCETQKGILESTCSIEKSINHSERWLERELRDRHEAVRHEVRDFRADVALAFAAAAKQAAECCCDTKMLIKDVEKDLAAQAVANYNALTMQAVQNQNSTNHQFCELSHKIDQGFCKENTKELERDLAAKQAALITAQAELNNLKQTAALIEALKKGNS